MTSAPAAVAAFERHRAAASNTVFKSGPLFISSKGIGWKSWKKRWFILTRTSLVFFKNDPSALPQRGGEVNLTLGGIDLNNSGSVVVREDKKLITVLFPDGRDGRAFTLKAETSEDLFEWKTALEQALGNAPNAALVMGHNGIFRNDNTDSFEGSIHQWRDKRPIKSLVVGRPILLALEDIDGGPSFLEKALCFLEMYGAKVEGILRQAADVEEVDRRVREYEQGRAEFAEDEDAHVVGDCIKHVLRELPSSPVPSSCCTALLEAYRIERKEDRVSAMQAAISETFPEPNRRLLQRILKMMHKVASHTPENRMTPSAVAACMAPLLLRPLLAGECELVDDYDLNGDNSAQLLAAANAANNAQAIITILLEEYENIFDDDNLQRRSLSPDSNMVDESGSEESVDEAKMIVNGNGFHDVEVDVGTDTNGGDTERVLSGKFGESSGYAGSDLYECKVFPDNDSDAEVPRNLDSAAKLDLRLASHSPKLQNGVIGKDFDNLLAKDSPKVMPTCEGPLSVGEILSSFDVGISHGASRAENHVERQPNKMNGSRNNLKRSNLWGRNNARKDQSTDSIDSSGEEELAIQRLEITKNDLMVRIAKEAKGNAILQASLERRKQALHERRLALEQDVSRLQEQLRAEKDLRATLEAGLSMSFGQFSSRGRDSKTRAELEEIALAEADVARLKQKVAELHLQLNQQWQHHYGPLSVACDRYQNLQPHLSHQRVVQHDFDLSLAFCNNERKQKSEESSSSTADWRYAGGNKQLSRKHSLDTNRGGGDSKDPMDGMEASVSSSSETNPSTLAANNAIKVGNIEGSESPPQPRRPSAAPSPTLVELTTRLDFFKERRSQLMEQLHNLDLAHGVSSKGPGSGSGSSATHRSSSPPWVSSPR